MASNILRHAVSVDISTNRTIYRGISQGGVARTSIGSPLFYYVSVGVAPMYHEQLQTIESDLFDMDYGVTPAQVALSAGVHNTITFTPSDSDAWSGAIVDTTVLINGRTTGGRYLNVKGLTGGASIAKGDWLQINPTDSNWPANARGQYKVYQVATATTANASGEAQIHLTTPLIGAPPNNATIIVDDQIQMQLLLTDYPTVTSIPGANGQPLYDFDGQFIFREVLI